MIVVFLALMMGLGVMFGMQALVVDLGYGMAQHGAMQNGADAGALAAGKLMAGSVSVDASNKVVYVVTDNQIHQHAADFVTANFVADLPSTTHAIAVQYLACPGQTDGKPNFTAKSDATLVADLINANAVPTGSARLATGLADHLGVGGSPDWNWASPICRVRVYARENHPGLFAATLANPPSSERELAFATARVFPTNPPITATNVWPTTRWEGAAGCTFTINSPCTFWDSQAGTGSFKNLVDMSRYSQLALTKKILRQQHIDDWDHSYPGPPADGDDLTNWLQFGWHGRLNVADTRCQSTNPNPLILSNCTNSRLETYNGTNTGKVAGAMQAFIETNSEGNDPNLGSYITMQVFLWKYGEINIDLNTDQASTLWTGAKSDPPASQIQRVILDQLRCFRFYANSLTKKQPIATGYYVSCPSTDPPINGAPSPIADTVALTD